MQQFIQGLSILAAFGQAKDPVWEYDLLVFSVTDQDMPEHIQKKLESLGFFKESPAGKNLVHPRWCYNIVATAEYRRKYTLRSSAL